MKITFWGTRGSIPTPSTTHFSTSEFGGDTTCIGIESGGKLILIDAGSGVRQAGLDCMKQSVKEAIFFFTHFHWDHIQGFPFFLPAYVPGNRFQFYGPELDSQKGQDGGKLLENLLQEQQRPLHFPVSLDTMAAEFSYSGLGVGESVDIPVDGGVLTFTTGALNHPGGSVGYRIEEKLEGKPTKVLTMATDTEHYDTENEELQKLAKDADALIYDAQYTPEEYEGSGGMSKKGWGHSTWEWGLREAETAGVKSLYLFHHDPLHDDSFIRELEEKACEAGKRMDIDTCAARQGDVLTL